MGRLRNYINIRNSRKKYDSEQAVKNILSKLNKLKPHSEKINQKISN